MSIWAEVREQARLQHESLSGSREELVPASELLDAAQSKTGIRREARSPDDALLDGAEAAYDSELKLILFSNQTAADLAAFYVAHEYAHHWLEELKIWCREGDLNLATPAEPEMSLVGESDAYSPRERSEAQANLFAREFLLPRHKLRKLCKQKIFDAKEIAELVGVPIELVMQQLADALLLPEERSKPGLKLKEPEPDDTQKEAIFATSGPHLVRAGPGTGKTRTLVGRVTRLVNDGEPPRSILVLTFSNFAAQDLALRIRASVGEAATGIWVGTFHAFGLELLRKYGSEIGLPLEVRLLDRSSSLALLEELLPTLQLDHYLDLFEPASKLRSILALISRAKDELITPTEYEKHARAIQDDSEFREKAIEAARAYGIYQSEMVKRGVVDFGDLIARPVDLLRSRGDIRDAIRAERRHVLVDEYQDMNRASGLLLRELVDPSEGPWVVGDVKQAIYRFRGGSPINMARFDRDFPGATGTNLGVNYRSGGKIVKTFQEFEKGMTSAKLAPFVALKAHRGESAGKVKADVALTFEAECEGIARKIKSDVKNGGAYGKHAILARSHTTLARLAKHLERAGVPCLYFGDFFERDEIRNLLSLLSVASERNGIGLLRVAQFPEYCVAVEDIARVFQWRREQDITMLSALHRQDEIDGLSDSSRSGLQRLRADLADVDYPMTAHTFLLRHLFKRGVHLAELLSDTTVAGQQRRLAIYQLLQFAFAFRSSFEHDPKRLFLEHVRRLECLDEEKQLRQLPAAASDIDAVRMMTVHASKGLQFPLVHLPTLTSRHFPSKRSDPNRLPPGLVDEDALMSREAEEESLFYVAMSRAEDGLNLTRACNYGGWKAVKPSEYLERIQSQVPVSSVWTEEGQVEAGCPQLSPPEQRESWPAYAIETYIECPRRFYYEHVLSLGSSNIFTPYQGLNKVLRSAIGWLRDAAPPERSLGSAARFSTDWDQHGPKGALEQIYRSAGEKMLAVAMQLLHGTSLPRDVSLTIGGNVILNSSTDHISRSPDGIQVFRFKTSRLSETEKTKARYAIAQVSLRDSNPGVAVEFDHVSLLSGERKRATIQTKKLEAERTKLSDAMNGIAGGHFEPVPSDFKCPRCPYFFVCPSHAEPPAESNE
jgi:superfamily I DNA/RNA helicase